MKPSYLFDMTVLFMAHKEKKKTSEVVPWMAACISGIRRRRQDLVGLITYVDQPRFEVGLFKRLIEGSL